MQLIIVLCLIAKLALVSGDCDVGKTVNDFDINKVSTDVFTCFRGSLLLSVICGVFKSTLSTSGRTLHNDVMTVNN